MTVPLMKLIHTADLHLGHRLSSYHRTAEYNHFFEWLLAQLKAEAADALIISGNIFDSPNPSAEAQRLLFDFLDSAVTENEGLQIVMTAGSQDSGDWLEAAEELLHHHNIYVRGNILNHEDGEADFEHLMLPLSRRGEEEACMVCFALPFLHRGDLPEGFSAEEGIKHFLRNMDKAFKKSDFSKLPVVLSAHLLVDGVTPSPTTHLKETVDLAALEGNYAYTALGGVNKAQSLDAKGQIRYAGSPLALSFAEQSDRRSVVAIELNGGKSADVRLLEYRPICQLETIPARGAADPAEAKKLITALPHRDMVPDTRRWSYVEIFLRAAELDETMRRSLFEILEQKAVRVCRITTADTRSKAVQPSSLQSKWRNLSPLELARRFYRERNEEEMSSELVARFQKAEAALND